MYRIYLAGPDVFHHDAAALGQRKKDLCTKYGFEGLFPLDGPELDTSLAPHEQGLALSAGCEAMMRKADLVIANLTPFRGPNADVGTCYEVGFMRALGKPVLAYANVYTHKNGTPGHKHADRVHGYAKSLTPRPDGSKEDHHRMQVENFDLVENLMLDGAVYYSGSQVVTAEVAKEDRYDDLRAFEECLRQAKALLPTAPAAVEA